MKKLGLLLIMFFSANSFAGGWSQTGKIVEIYNHGYTVMVRMDGTFVDRSDGACSGQNFYAIDSSNGGFDTIFSQILMAYASGKTTRFFVNGPSCSGQGKAYQTILSIRTY